MSDRGRATLVLAALATLTALPALGGQRLHGMLCAGSAARSFVYLSKTFSWISRFSSRLHVPPGPAPRGGVMEGRLAHFPLSSPYRLSGGVADWLRLEVGPDAGRRPLDGAQHGAGVPDQLVLSAGCGLWRSACFRASFRYSSGPCSGAQAGRWQQRDFGRVARHPGGFTFFAWCTFRSSTTTNTSRPASFTEPAQEGEETRRRSRPRRRA